jgi:hypothetical protein
MMRKRVKTILVVLICLGFSALAYSLSPSQVSNLVLAPDGVPFSDVEIKWMRTESHILRLNLNLFHLMRDPTINKEFPEIFSEIREIPRRFVLPTQVHDIEKLTQKMEELLLRGR